MENLEELEITEDAMKMEYQEPTSTKRKREDSTPWRILSDENSMRGIPVWKGDIPESDSVQRPIEYFRKLFENDLMIAIVHHQGNLYSVQSNPNKPLNLTRLEFERFLGTLFLMSMIKISCSRLYWSGLFPFNDVSDVFTRDRWEEIK